MVTSRQFNVHYASVFIKQIVQLSFANVEWEVPDEDCVVVVVVVVVVVASSSSSRHEMILLLF